MTSRIHLGAALLLAVLAAGCAGEGAEQLFVKPGRFDYLSCAEIAKTRENTARREQELKILIERAQKDTFGAILGEGSYRGVYLQAQGEQKMLAEVAVRKNCAAEPPVPAPAATTSSGPVPARR